MAKPASANEDGFFAFVVLPADAHVQPRGMLGPVDEVHEGGQQLGIPVGGNLHEDGLSWLVHERLLMHLPGARSMLRPP